MFRNALTMEFRFREKPGAVRAEPLTLQTKAICLSEALSASAVIKDGFASIKTPKNPMGEWMKGLAEAAGPVREEALLRNVRVCGMKLPEVSRVYVREEPMSLVSVARSFALHIKPCAVHASDVLIGRGSSARDGNRFLMRSAVIPATRYKMALQPHRRDSVRIESLKEADRESFLREAESLKGIPADRSELLGVFRHVPIEVISRMRFVAKGRVLLYSIAGKPCPSSTRVHDMAAVFDAGNRAVYLIPHRTRFRSVSLN